MDFLKKLRLNLLMCMLFLLCSVLNPRLIQATANDDLIIAKELSNITGVSVNEIINCKNSQDNWKETNQHIFNKFTFMHKVNITQQTVNDLRSKGFNFADILIAARLAAAFNSNPEAILKLKPSEMKWGRFGGLLQQYKLYQNVF